MKNNSLGQLIMTGVPGKELDSKTAALFQRIQPGAFILFGRNIDSATQLRKLIDDLRDLSDVEPIITIDQEGGRVSRLRLIGSEPPSAQQLRDKDDLNLIRRHGESAVRFAVLDAGFGKSLQLLIEKIFLKGGAKAEVESLFSQLPLIAAALLAVGVLIIYSGLREEQSRRYREVDSRKACWIGAIQGLCLPNEIPEPLVPPGPVCLSRWDESRDPHVVCLCRGIAPRSSATGAILSSEQRRRQAACGLGYRPPGQADRT